MRRGGRQRQTARGPSARPVSRGYRLHSKSPTQRGREIGFSRQWRPTQKQRATVLSAGGAPDATGLNPSRRRLRQGPRPARHLDFHSPDALSLRCRLPQERLAIDSVLPVVGWESTERLECNCVREIGLGNKHGRSIEAMHSFPLPLELDTKLSAPRKTGRAVRQEELDREREPLEVLREVSGLRHNTVRSPQQ